MYSIPSDRRTTWNPGMMSVGGIPNRTTIYATLAPGDNIQAAIDACPVGQVVKLGAGDFAVSGNSISLVKGITLRGSGPGVTRIVASIGRTLSCVDIGPKWATDNDAKYVQTLLTADAPKGQTYVTVTSTSGLVVGDLVLVDELYDSTITNWGNRTDAGFKGWFCRTNRPISQVVEILSIVGNQVNFTTPLHMAFRTAQSAALSRYTAGVATRLAGIEDLTLVNGEGGDGGGGLHFFHAAYCWAKHIETTNTIGDGVDLDAAFCCEVRDSYLHDARVCNPASGGYLLGFDRGAADNLVENCICIRGNKTIVMRCSGGGNVIAYNYMDDAYGRDYPSIAEVGLNAAHMSGSHMELFEGNQSFNFDGDSVWGSSVYITAFRNWLTGRRLGVAKAGDPALSDANNRRAIGLTLWHYWYNFVGNILGTQGQTLISPQSAFAYEINTFNTSTVGMWKLGYDGNDGSQPQDTLVPQRTLRDGNFDWVSGQQRWHGIGGAVGAGTPDTLPNSLYLPGKPAFFGSATWPWVDPTTGATTALPAKARYDAGTPNDVTPYVNGYTMSTAPTVTYKTGGNAYPVSVASQATASVSISAGSRVMVIAGIETPSNTATPLTCSWTGGTPAGATAFTTARDNVSAGATTFACVIFTATCTNAYTGTFTIGVPNVAGTASLSWTVWQVTGSTGIGPASLASMNRTASSTGNNQGTVTSVSAYSQVVGGIFNFSGAFSATTFTAVTGSTRDYTGSPTSADFMVANHLTNGTTVAGNVTFGCNEGTGSGFWALSAVELLGTIDAPVVFGQSQAEPRPPWNPPRSYTVAPIGSNDLLVVVPYCPVQPALPERQARPPWNPERTMRVTVERPPIGIPATVYPPDADADTGTPSGNDINMTTGQQVKYRITTAGGDVTISATLTSTAVVGTVEVIIDGVVYTTWPFGVA